MTLKKLDDSEDEQVAMIEDRVNDEIKKNIDVDFLKQHLSNLFGGIKMMKEKFTDYVYGSRCNQDGAIKFSSPLDKQSAPTSYPESIEVMNQVAPGFTPLQVDNKFNTPYESNNISYEKQVNFGNEITNVNDHFKNNQIPSIDCWNDKVYDVEKNSFILNQQYMFCKKEDQGMPSNAFTIDTQYANTL